MHFTRSNKQLVVKHLNENKFKPLIRITPYAYEKQRLIIESSPINEIAWYGWVKQTAENIFHIYDVFAPKQEVSPAFVKITLGGTYQANDYGISKHGTKGSEDIKMWGHSHVNMGISPSTTDESTMSEYASENMSFYICNIGNLKGEMDFRLIVSERGERYDYVPWQIASLKEDDSQNNQQEKTLSKIKDRIKRKVFVPAPKPNKTTIYHKNTNGVIMVDYDDDDDDDDDYNPYEGLLKNK